MTVTVTLEGQPEEVVMVNAVVVVVDFVVVDVDVVVVLPAHLTQIIHLLNLIIIKNFLLHLSLR